MKLAKILCCWVSQHLVLCGSCDSTKEELKLTVFLKLLIKKLFSLKYTH